MPSNKDLSARALELGAALGEAVSVDGLNNPALTALVDGLEAKLAAASAPEPHPAPEPPPTPPSADPPPVIDGTSDGSVGGPPAPAPEAPPPQRFAYQVAAGKAITSPRGMLGPGQEITARDVGGGAEQLELLVSKGYVTKA